MRKLRRSNLKICPEKKTALFVIGLGLIAILLNGCAVSSQGDFCDTYMPVYVDVKDTEETKWQNDLNNAVYMERCL